MENSTAAAIDRFLQDKFVYHNNKIAPKGGPTASFPAHLPTMIAFEQGEGKSSKLKQDSYIYTLAPTKLSIKTEALV